MSWTVREDSLARNAAVIVSIKDQLYRRNDDGGSSVASMLQKDCDAAYELAKNGNHEGAIEACDRLIDRYPDRLEPIRARASVSMYTGDYQAAATDLRALAERGTPEPSDYYDLGRACFQLQEYETAIDALSRAVCSGERAQFAYYEKAALLLRAEARLRVSDYSGAVEDCMKVGADYAGYVPGIGARRAADILAVADRQSNCDQ